MAKFENVSCSQCGKDFGPGDHGFSHCDSHMSHATRLRYLAEISDDLPLHFQEYMHEAAAAIEEMIFALDLLLRARQSRTLHIVSHWEPASKALATARGRGNTIDRRET